jgi:hypothetical protein
MWKIWMWLGRIRKIFKRGIQKLDVRKIWTGCTKIGIEEVSKKLNWWWGWGRGGVRWRIPFVVITWCFKISSKYFTTVFDYVHDGWSNTQPQVSVHTGQIQEYFRVLFFPFLREGKNCLTLRRNRNTNKNVNFYTYLTYHSQMAKMNASTITNK